MNKLALNLIVFAASISGTLAQTVPADSLKTYTSAEVVITGQYEPQSLDKSVYKIRVIPMERIKARGAVQLQDILNTELNIRFEQDQALGTSNMSLQGLAGQNIKLLIDGVPQVGRQSTDNSFNINQVNVNSIERIEIIEGPMSVIYGADALAGVINIITKKSPDGKLDLNARVHEETVGKEYGLSKGIHNESVGVAYAKNKFNTRFDISKNRFGGFKGDSTGREEAWHPKSQWLGDALVGYQSDKSRVYYRVDYLWEDIYNPGNYGAGGGKSNIALDQHYISKRLMHQVQGAHTFSDKASFTGAFAYTNYSRKTQTTTVDEDTGDVFLSTGPGQQDVTTFNGATFRGTFQYKISDKLMLQPGVDLNREVGEGGRLMAGAHSIGDYAGFISGEWTVVRGVQLRPGLRFMHNTKYNAPPALPSLNAKITINRRQDVRLSYGHGFRAPSLRELYFNFIDASHNIQGNPDLQAELSNSYNATWNLNVYDVDGRKMTTAITGFYNDISNMIGTASLGNASSYLNFARYKTKGFNWNNVYKSRNWDLSLGASYTGRYNQYRDYDEATARFQWTPEVTGMISYRTNEGGWIFSGYYKYTGVTPFAEPPLTTNGITTVHIAKLDAYQWSDISVQKQLGKNFSATAGIRNLFNVKSIGSSSIASGAHSGGNIRPIGSGRSLFFDINYNFNN